MTQVAANTGIAAAGEAVASSETHTWNFVAGPAVAEAADHTWIAASIVKPAASFASVEQMTYQRCFVALAAFALAL